MPTLTLTHDLIGARASFQRLRDAKILHGWIEAIEGARLLVRASLPVSLGTGEQFAFRVTGPHGDVAFEATLRTEGQTASGTRLQNSEEQMLLFEAGGRMVTLPPSGDPRFRSSIGTVFLGTDGLEARVQDVSPEGLGLLVPVAFQRGQTTRVVIGTPAGEVVTEAEVRYCRKASDAPVSYRVGLYLNALDRVNRARWNTLLPRH
jgi:hypothetical protein